MLLVPTPKPEDPDWPGARRRKTIVIEQIASDEIRSVYLRPPFRGITRRPFHPEIDSVMSAAPNHLLTQMLGQFGSVEIQASPGARA